MCVCGGGGGSKGFINLFFRGEGTPGSLGRSSVLLIIFLRGGGGRLQEALAGLVFY